MLDRFRVVGCLHHGLVVGKHVVVVVVGGCAALAGVFAAEAVEVDQVLVGGQGSGHCVEAGAARLAVAQRLVLGEELLLLLLVAVELVA